MQPKPPRTHGPDTAPTSREPGRLSPLCGSMPRTVPSVPTDRHAARLGAGWGVSGRASSTWFNHHAELVERVFLAGDVHVLTEKGPARGSFQAGVGSPWAEGTRGPKTGQTQGCGPGGTGLLPPGGHKRNDRSLCSMPPLLGTPGQNGAVPQLPGPHRAWSAQAVSVSQTSRRGATPCPVTVTFPYLCIFIGSNIFGDSNFIFYESRVFSSDCSHRTRETITQNFSTGDYISFWL